MRPSRVLVVPMAVLILASACGGASAPAAPPAEPPRDLGPADIGPVPPEIRHIDAETYTIDVEAPPGAKVRDRVVVGVTIKTKGDLVLQNPSAWKLEPKGPKDVDLLPVVASPVAPLVVKTMIKYEVPIIPLRSGIKHFAFHVGGSVCDNDFCDVVADQVSFNLDVK
jgi:hypothetical protein